MLCSSCKKNEVETTASDSLMVSTTRDTAAHITRPSSDTIEASTTDSSHASFETGEQLLPVDEADQDPGFTAYRQQLTAAVKAKSEDRLLPLLDPNIRLSFGGSSGLSDFRRTWKPQDPSSPLWSKLGWVVGHGGSFRAQGKDKSFWAPYVYSNWPENGPDAFEYAVATEPRVEVYSKPDTASPVLSLLKYHYVKSLDGGHLREKQPDFVKVRTGSGAVGYVRSSQVRSQLDYRAGFQQVNGKWRMTAFIAGD